MSINQQSQESSLAALEEDQVEAWSFYYTCEYLSQKLTSPSASIAHEMAAWMFIGYLQGYVNVNELGFERPFHFSILSLYIGDSLNPIGFDYLPSMQGCRFRPDDIRGFDPPERYITGGALVTRWTPYCFGESGAKAKIHSCICESRLVDMHPVYGGTEAGEFQKDPLRPWPPLEMGLFALSEIEAIEADDFGGKRLAILSPENAEPGHAPSEDRVLAKRALLLALKSYVRDSANLEGLLSNANKYPALSACKPEKGRGWKLRCVFAFLAERGDLKQEYMDQFGKVGGLDRLLREITKS